MAFGFKARNANNAIQIDETWQTLRYVFGGSLNITNNANSSGFVTLPSPIQLTNAPLFASRSTVAHVVAHTPIANVTNTSQIGLSTSIEELRICILSGGSTPKAASWLCVDASPVAASAETFGMRVMNASGNIVFDSRQKIVLVRDVLTIGRGVLQELTLTHAVCRGQAYYVSGLSQAYNNAFGIEPVIYTKAIDASTVSAFLVGRNQLSFLPAQVPLIVLDVFDA